MYTRKYYNPNNFNAVHASVAYLAFWGMWLAVSLIISAVAYRRKFRFLAVELFQHDFAVGRAVSPDTALFSFSAGASSERRRISHPQGLRNGNSDDVRAGIRICVIADSAVRVVFGCGYLYQRGGFRPYSAGRRKRLRDRHGRLCGVDVALYIHFVPLLPAILRSCSSAASFCAVFFSSGRCPPSCFRLSCLRWRTVLISSLSISSFLHWLSGFWFWKRKPVCRYGRAFCEQFLCQLGNAAHCDGDVLGRRRTSGVYRDRFSDAVSDRRGLCGRRCRILRKAVVAYAEKSGTFVRGCSCSVRRQRYGIRFFAGRKALV